MITSQALRVPPGTSTHSTPSVASSWMFSVPHQGAVPLVKSPLVIWLTSSAWAGTAVSPRVAAQAAAVAPTRGDLRLGLDTGVLPWRGIVVVGGESACGGHCMGALPYSVTYDIETGSLRGVNGLRSAHPSLRGGGAGAAAPAPPPTAARTHRVNPRNSRTARTRPTTRLNTVATANTPIGRHPASRREPTRNSRPMLAKAAMR